MSTLNDIDTGTPMDGDTVQSLAQQVRELKLIVKNLFLNAHNNDGSLKAITLSGLAADSVGSDQIADLSVVTAALANSAVTEPKIATGAVTSGKLAEGAVNTAALGADAVTAAKIADNAVLNDHIGEAIIGAKIASHASVDADRAIGANHIKDVAVTNRAVNDVSIGKLTGGTDSQFLFKVAGAWAGVTVGGALTYNVGTGQFELASQLKIATFGDSKARGSSGGMTTANTWIIRDLGQFSDVDNIVVFTGNTFKLTQGSYLFVARVPAVGVSRHQARLFRDNGDSTNVIELWGTSAVATAANEMSFSEISGVFEVTSDDWVYEIQHWCLNSVGANDLGLAASSDNAVVYGNHMELYTQGYAVKLA